tara:strand:+ start:120 stop:371 length:252 start_codon:yes stop_codon:yes gene_type:complete
MAKQRFSGPKYANGNHKSQQKAYMKGKGRKIRLEADRLAAKLPGGKVGDGLDASHNKNGPGKHGWEKASSNRKSRLKVKRKSK